MVLLSREVKWVPDHGNNEGNKGVDCLVHSGAK